MHEYQKLLKKTGIEEKELIKALILFRDLRKKSFIRGIDPRATRIALIHTYIIDTYVATYEIGLPKEKLKEIENVSVALAEHTLGLNIEIKGGIELLNCKEGDRDR